jgi:hypothetical protein
MPKNWVAAMTFLERELSEPGALELAFLARRLAAYAQKRLQIDLR